MLDAPTKALDAEILRFIKKFSDMPSPDSEFETLAFQIFDYQFKRNRNYRKFCLFEGKQSGKLSGWKEIPAMPALGFKELVLSTFPIQKAVKIFKTSGTSQEVKGAHFFDTLRLYEAAILPTFKCWVLPDEAECSFFFLVTSPKEWPHSSLSHMAGVVNRDLACGKGRNYIHDGKLQGEALVKDLSSERKKVCLFTTTFSLKGFLNYLRVKKITLRLPKGSRLMETGGFKGLAREVSKSALYTECQKRLGIEKSFCVSEYGMTELSSQFYDTTLGAHFAEIKRKPFKFGPAWTRTLVIDPSSGKEAKKGKVGVLRHLDLANRGSVLAIQTEDLGRQSGEGFELLGRSRGAERRGCSLSYEEFLTQSSVGS